MLDDLVIAQYDGTATLKTDSSNTVGAVFGDMTGIFCGLFADKTGIVIKDWNFNNMVDVLSKYTVSGTVSTGLAAANVSDATLTFVDKVDASRTYTVQPNAEGQYSVNVPSGNYKVTVSYSTYYENNTFDCLVWFDDVTRNISLRKNKTSGTSFVMTEDGNYRSNAANSHNRFQSGYGNAWIAELKVPNLANNQGVGFVLHKANGTDPIWGRWMRILVKKADDGNLKLVTHMHVNEDLNGGMLIEEATQKQIDISATSVEGKTLKVALQNGNIRVMLDGAEIAQYNSTTTLKSGSQNTVGAVFDDMTGIFCGLLADTTGIEIKDWSFTNK